MRVISIRPSGIYRICALFYNGTGEMKDLAEWGISTHGLFKHWYQFCIGQLPYWHDVDGLNKQCIKCGKEIPPGVELALRLYKGR